MINNASVMVNQGGVVSFTEKQQQQTPLSTILVIGLASWETHSRSHLSEQSAEIAWTAEVTHPRSHLKWPGQQR